MAALQKYFDNSILVLVLQCSYWAESSMLLALVSSVDAILLPKEEAMGSLY